MQDKTDSINKLVCCADILGFSPKFTGMPKEKKILIYSEIIEALKSACHRVSDYRKTPAVFSLKRTNLYWFSDTFIIFSDHFSFEEDPNDFIEDLLRDFFQSVKILFLRFLYHGFPLRGGIDYGEFIVAPDQNIYIGEALIRAYKDSEKQKWSGISLSNELTKKILSYYKTAKFLTDYLTDYEIPLKKNHVKISKVIDWPNDLTIKRKEEPEKYIRHKFERYCEPLGEKEERYLRNTITFLRKRLKSVDKIF